MHKIVELPMSISVASVFSERVLSEIKDTRLVRLSFHLGILNAQFMNAHVSYEVPIPSVLRRLSIDGKQLPTEQIEGLVTELNNNKNAALTLKRIVGHYEEGDKDIARVWAELSPVLAYTAWVQLAMNGVAITNEPGARLTKHSTQQTRALAWLNEKHLIEATSNKDGTGARLTTLGFAVYEACDPKLFTSNTIETKKTH